MRGAVHAPPKLKGSCEGEDARIQHPTAATAHLAAARLKSKPCAANSTMRLLSAAGLACGAAVAGHASANARNYKRAWCWPAFMLQPAFPS